MYLLGLAVLLSLLKLAEFGPVGAWSWWVILGVYAAAALWWTWADWSGYTKRKAEEKIELRKKERIQRQKKAMQTGVRRR
jgi:small Trp-rich protein